MKKNKLVILLSFFVLMLSISCNKINSLDEETYGHISIVTATSPGGGAAATLAAAYTSLNPLVSQYGYQAMQEHSTDELLGPTRGTDWDDFGTWRKLHAHTWDASHNQINDVWTNLNTGVYNAGAVYETGADASIRFEAQFLRAFFAFTVMDNYGQVPYRSYFDPVSKLPIVYTRSQAYDFIEKDLLACADNLPTWAKTNRFRATKEAAYFLLAKLTLNKAVYKQDPKNPAGPYTFDAADMNKVLLYLSKIQSNSLLTLNANYWDNFKWDNYNTANELIFGRSCNNDNFVTGQLGSDVDVQWLTAMGSHYNDWFGGWNGFTTTADFYNSFGATDIRKGQQLSNYNKTGFVAGFRVGQQVKPDGNGGLINVNDRSGSPLVFTPNVSLFFSTEALGIRTNKYPLNDDERQSFGEKHDFHFFRLADVVLMAAEAIMRGGTGAGVTPVSLVNIIRQRSGQTALTTATLDDILAERGRELYLEAWRRNDLIRFGKFNQPVNERSLASPGFRVVYPIPTIAIASNPNLSQNFGY